MGLVSIGNWYLAKMSITVLRSASVMPSGSPVSGARSGGKCAVVGGAVRDMAESGLCSAWICAAARRMSSWVIVCGVGGLLLIYSSLHTNVRRWSQQTVQKWVRGKWATVLLWVQMWGRVGAFWLAWEWGGWCGEWGG